MKSPAKLRLLKTDPNQWPDILWSEKNVILRSTVLPEVKSIDVAPSNKRLQQTRQ